MADLQTAEQYKIAEVDLDAFFSKKDKKKKTKVITTEDLFEKQLGSRKSKKKEKQNDNEQRRDVQTASNLRGDEDDGWMDESLKQEVEPDEKKYENLKLKLVNTDNDEADEAFKRGMRNGDDAGANGRSASAACWKRTEAETAAPPCISDEKAAEEPVEELKKCEPANELSEPTADGSDAAKKSAYVPPHMRNRPKESSEPSSAAPAAASGIGWRERERMKQEREAETRTLEPVRLADLRRPSRKNELPQLESADEFPALNLGALKKEVQAVATSGAAQHDTQSKKAPRRARERTISLSEFNKQPGSEDRQTNDSDGGEHEEEES